MYIEGANTDKTLPSDSKLNGDLDSGVFVGKDVSSVIDAAIYKSALADLSHFITNTRYTYLKKLSSFASTTFDSAPFPSFLNMPS